MTILTPYSHSKVKWKGFYLDLALNLIFMMQWQFSVEIQSVCEVTCSPTWLDQRNPSQTLTPLPLSHLGQRLPLQ